jgi:2-methylcitrate dehydratase PrpD
VARLRLGPTHKVGSTGFAANTYAPFSAAVAAGLLLGLRGESLARALGWAYSQCAGSVQLQQGGDSALHLHHGLAAANGVQAALLARHGLPVCGEFLSGKFGLFNAYERGEYDSGQILDGLGERYEMSQVAIKQYPSGRVIHPAVDAALELRATHQVAADDIDGVDVVYTAGGHNMTCEPAERRQPTTSQHAKFSLFYNLACALVRGHVWLQDFTTEAVRDPEVQKLASRIRVEVDPALRDVIPPGNVCLTLRDGRQLHKLVPHALGTPQNPVTFADCAAKLRSAGAYAALPLEESKLERVVELVGQLEQQRDVSCLIPLLLSR